MFDWTYYTEKDGFLFDENGDREKFDGQKRSADEWDEYLVKNDIRGTITN